MKNINKKINTQFNVSAVSKSISAILLLSAFNPLYAQQANDEVEATETIQVTGNRATMTRSLSEKKNTVAIVDAIAAADFGELPGLSLSDVIENITSVSGHRGKGSASEMSIRGLGPFLGYATFNQRTVTSAGDSRAVNFKKFPSELSDKVVVYKSQQADLIEGGVAGTINVDPLKALDYGKRQVIAEIEGVYNSHTARQDDYNGLGSELNLSYVDQIRDTQFGDFGFSLGYKRADSSNPEESVLSSSTMYSCATRLADGTPLNRTSGDCEDDSNTNVDRDNISQFDQDSVFITPSSYTFRNQEEEDEREAFVGTLQWQPNSDWDINLDVEYSNNFYFEDRHDFILTSARRSLDDHIIGDDHSLQYMTGIAKLEAQGYYREEDETYNGLGLNVEHYVNDKLRVELDLSYSKSWRNRTSWKSRVVTGDYWNYALDLSNNRLPELTFLDENRKAEGDAGYTGVGVFDPTSPQSWSTEYNNGKATRNRYEREMDERFDRLKAVKFDAEYVLDNDIFTSVKAGVRYSEESLYSDNDTDRAINPVTGEDTAEYQVDDTVLGNLLIENCFKDWSNPEWMSSEDGKALSGNSDLGIAANQWAQFDGRCGFANISQQGELQADGTYSFVDIKPYTDRRSAGDDLIDENILALYAMGNIYTNLFGYDVTGNIGVRVVETQIESTGYAGAYEITSTVQDDGTTNYKIQAIEGEIDVYTRENKSVRVLPSANLSFHLDNDVMLRFAAYKALSRPNLQDLGAGRIISTSDDNDITDPTDLINRVDGDNPYMDPLMSTNADISLEWYPSQDMYLSGAFYFKKFAANFRSVQLDETLTIDGQEIATIVNSSAYTSDPAYLRGIELSYQHNFAFLPEPFDGLGTKLSYNYASSSFENEDGAFGDAYNAEGELTQEGYDFIEPANVFGFSKNVFSGSVYWDIGDFEFRVLYKSRSKYFQPNSGATANRYVEPFEYVDATAKYKISKNYSVSFKAQNVLDEAQYMTRGTQTTPTLISSSGPKYFLSFKAKF
ncbi:TonB-dependent receptor [Catenovulum sp. 2E275]|uniref:TonB-dependent receptor n=1 Tax=Catenovulum sp. 2E275 TaxID=2980497 RepID=UPI0021D24D75|nr:TonB-dependent receptor [Catenovulum sp. 2E275]MCU4674022.1 TonB-dependent receptor [Catenovulum sp. 2E275]